MAVRQYIGARYVIKVYENSADPSSAEWESGVTYEPLTLVTYQNSSYLSKKLVSPSVGAPASNSTYWVVTGYYNGQIAALDERVTEVEAEVEELVSTSHMSGKRVLLIGDSYESRCHWGTFVSQYLGHGSPSTVIGSLRKSSDNMVWLSAQGGMGFTNNGGGKASGNGFLTLVQNAANAMTAEEKASLDLVCFVGCVNDAFYPVGDPQYNLLHENMSATAAYIKENFPVADVLVFFLGRIRGTNPSNITLNDLKVAIQHFQGECGIMGWGYVTNSQYILYVDDAAIDDDNMHPTAIYGPHTATHIVSGMITGACDVRGLPRETFEITPVSPFGTSCKLSREVVNGVTYIRINTFAFTTSSNVTLPYESFVKVGTQNAFYANKPILRQIPALIREKSPVDDWRTMIATVKFDGYDIYISNQGSESGGVYNLSVAAIILCNTTYQFEIDTIDI